MNSVPNNVSTYQLLREKFPFLTIVSYLNTEYVGIIQNSDNNFISIYVLDPHVTIESKKEFLQCGETWYWASNRNIPINLFLRDQFKPFKSWLKTFSKKEAIIVEGPCINMIESMGKKLKRRTITVN